MKKLFRVALLAMFVVTLSASATDAEETVYYSIKKGGKLIGYAETHVDQVSRDGRELVQVKSTTLLKVALLGAQREIVLDSETQYDADTRMPVSYRSTSETNEVKTHVDSEFSVGAVRSWSYREGDERGDAVETKLGDEHVCVLGGNNFAHWQRVLEAVSSQRQAETASVTVFLPEVKRVDRLQLTRGDATEYVRSGVSRKAVSWNVVGAGMELLADAESGEMVRMQVPKQDTLIELADAGVVASVKKTQAEEMLAGNFLQSNVVFDDYMKVTHLVVDVDVEVIGSGIEDSVDVLTTGMQAFAGDRKKAQIKGTVTIASRPYKGEDSPGFPVSDTDAELQRWLQPSQCIESDCDEIVSQAAALCHGAKTRWDAVERIGKWVKKEIKYTIADTPSARLALEKKQGDCGPHSTLMIAMLRAEGIPARLVGGLVFTPSFGGSFGQHAWVEVHLGPAGWIAVDPTTGEFEQISATHIKLFEGLGGVVPKSIEVTAYKPENRPVAYTPQAVAKPLAWKLDKEYTFQYRKGDKNLGDETFRIVQQQRADGPVLVLTSDVKLAVNILSSMTSDTRLVVSPNARPIEFARNFQVMMKKTTVECTFSDGKVQTKISGSQNMSREIQLPEGVYCFDNNLMSSWVLIASQLQLEASKPVSFRTFHPSSLQIIPLTITPKKLTEITIGGKPIACWECEVSTIKNTFWIARDGRFLRAAQGELVIELKSEE